MYAYIAPDGAVGQLFEAKPPAGRYHPSFTDAIRLLPDGVTAGWTFDGGQWAALAAPETRESGGYAELWRIVSALSGGTEGA